MAAGRVSIGERIAIERRRRGRSQAVLAERLGKSAQWLSNIERGVRSADRYSVLYPIAELLGMSVAELAGAPAAAPAVRDAESECVRAIRVALAGFGFTPPHGYA